jgi:type IV fimbrial biogenesis protein FimT
MCVIVKRSQTGHMTHQRPKPKLKSRSASRGVSMLECCMALAVLSLLLLVGVPLLKDWQDRISLQGQSQELVARIMNMRSEAIMKNHAVRMTFITSPGGTCYVVHTGPADSCACDGQGNASCSSDIAKVLATQHWDSRERVQIFANVRSILFDPRTGLAAPGGTVRLVNANGQELRHIVSLRGRVRTCSVDKNFYDQVPCTG